MATERTRISLSLFVIAILIMFTSCDHFIDNELTDKRQTLTLYVSAETSNMVGLNGEPHECLLVKENGQTSWNPCEFKGIHGFTYEKGFSYELLVTKTIYANPPADGGKYSYELISEVSKIPSNTECESSN